MRLPFFISNRRNCPYGNISLCFNSPRSVYNPCVNLIYLGEKNEKVIQ